MGVAAMQIGRFVRYRLEILATLRGELRTGYYLHRRLIAIFVGSASRVALPSPERTRWSFSQVKRPSPE